jgi:hypothetical protein
MGPPGANLKTVLVSSRVGFLRQTMPQLWPELTLCAVHDHSRRCMASEYD